MKMRIEGKEILGRLPGWLERLEIVAGSALFCLIVVLLWQCGDHPERLVENRYLFLCVLPCLLIVGSLYLLFMRRAAKACQDTPLTMGKHHGRVADFAAGVHRHPELWLLLGYGLVLAVQILWISRVYFYMGWDVNMLQYRVESIVNGGAMADTSADVGYSVCPNNLFLFYVFCIIEKIGMLFSMSEPYHLCIYISCFCVNGACFLGHLILRRLTDSRVIRGWYVAVALALILFSPWIMVPYSDTYGMFFAMLGMWSLLCLDVKYLKWVVVAFAAVIGYHVKPSCIFPLFAAFLVYGVEFLCSLRERWRELCALVLCAAAFWGIGLCIPLWIQYTYSFRLVPEYELTYTHYMMMGFNPDTKGIYSYDDNIFSGSYPNVETREAANREVLRDRIDSMRAEKRFGQFLREKAMVNFNDGTFAWGDGNPGFFAGYVAHEGMATRWFQSLMVPSNAFDAWEYRGTYYELYRTVMQLLWLQTLLGTVFAWVGRRNRREKACMIIVLCGLTAFVMLFEARARYLFLYAPLFLVLSLCGYEAVFRKIAGLLGRNRES